MLAYFAMPGMAAARTPSHDVTLVNTRHDTTPKNPQALAQGDLEGAHTVVRPKTYEEMTPEERLKLETEITEKIRAYNLRPKRTQINASAVQSRFAQYVEHWRARTERIAERHYPEAARGKVYGSLVMTVSIKRDGSIEKIVIVRPSKHPILNAAAEKIVRLGEPYDPFPPEITQDTDILDITRTWTFTNDKLAVTTK